MRRALPVVLLGTAAAATPAALAQQAKPDGVDVGKPSVLRNLVPAADLEASSAKQYAGMLQQAAQKNALVPATHPQAQRLRAIARKLIPNAARFNARASQWKWEVNLISSRNINAFCMPGGKIAVFTGILDGLKLSDDEAAIVLGHEIAHALREHARERLAKSELTHLGATLLGSVVGGGRYAGAFDFGGSLLTLKFSRDNETDADLVGLDIAARSGYDPRAGITLWEKMTAASKGAPPSWLSTHPAGTNRIAEIRRHLPQVLPLYAKATGRSMEALAAGR